MEDVERLHEAAGRSMVLHPSANTDYHGAVRSSLEVPTTRVYAHVTAEAQVAIGDPFSSARRNPALDGKTGERSKPIQTLNDTGFLEVYPRSSSRQPHLLQQLELLLQDKLHKGEKMASPLGPGHRDPAIAANLKLHAHRDVWEAFINSFGTYKPLMAEIKREYDAALHNSLIAAAENLSMRLELAAAEETRAASVEEAVREITASTSGVMTELNDKLAATERRASQLEARAVAVEGLAASARTDAEACKEAVERSKAVHTQLVERLAGEQKWLSQPGAKHVVDIDIGPYAEEIQEEDGEDAGRVVEAPPVVEAGEETQ